MSYKARSLFTLIEEINRDTFLPHIQRPFVWDEDQIVRLFDSLMRNYPIQTFLFWRTKDEIKVRRFMEVILWDMDLHELYDEAKSQDQVDKILVLDGQQRLQSLYAVFCGGIQDTKRPDIKVRAFFDVTSGTANGEEDLRYRLVFSEHAVSTIYYRVADLMTKDAQKNAEDIAESFNERLDSEFGEDKERAKRVRRNFSQLVSLLREDKYFWAQTLDGVANSYPYRNILDIFVRVNSGGTRLSAADLMFAAMKTEFSDIEQNIEDTVELLGSTQLPFERDFVLKCLLVALGRGAAVDLNKLKSGDFIQDLKTSWSKADAAFEQLVDFISIDLRVVSAKIVLSFTSLVPLFDYFFHHPKPAPEERVKMRAYFYRSQLFNWFGRSTDYFVDRMHGLVSKTTLGKFPLEEASQFFASYGSDTILNASHLSSSKLRSLLLNLVYVENFGSSPFQVRYKDNEPQIDHIFPQSPLRTRFGLPSNEINHIGNLRFIGASDNLRKRAELPASYFPRLKASGVPVEKHLLVPKFASNPALLKMDLPTYQHFRNERAQAIMAVAERVVNVCPFTQNVS